MTGRNVLRDLHLRWRRRKTAESIGAGLFVGTLAGAAVTVLAPTMDMPGAVGLGLTAFVGVLTWRLLRQQITDGAIAQHLDRVTPGVEDSSHLLLGDADDLQLVGRLQRARVERNLVASRDEIPLPSGPLVRAGMFVGGSVLFVLLALIVPPPFAGLGSTPDAQFVFEPLTASNDRVAPVVVSSTVTIQPPGYTGLGRTTADWSFEAAEGSALRWDIELDRGVDGLRLIFGGGDTVAASGDGINFRARRTAMASELYHVEISSGDNPLGDKPLVSPFHRIAVIADAPPNISVGSPEERTTIDPAGVWDVAVRATVTDDYGVAAADIVATVTSGAGESVVFREDVIALTPVGGAGAERSFRATLDLQELGMGVGDELYFYLRATDNRLPEPNRSRTEMFFATIPDTADAPELASEGMAVNPFPQAVLSQRQIIVDTERLIAQRDSLSRERFESRSNMIGFGQKQVRLRYGQFLGEEEESGDDLHEGHMHDTEVGATTFEPEVRIRLQGALAQMWDAELHLHLADPATALPFEYRALELLVEIQALQRREYVKRIGFDPPPLRPDERRLTGDLDDIANINARSRMPDLRDGPVTRALAVLTALRAGEIPVGAVAALQRANTPLAAAAVNSETDLIPALEDMRLLISSLAEGRTCDSCLGVVERGLWTILPPARARPAIDAARSGALGRSYLSTLQDR